MKNKYIVCFGPNDWWGMNPSCTSHIMKRLSDDNKVLYINPFSSDILGVSSKKGLMSRISRKLKSMLKIFKKVNPNLLIASPLFFPMQGNKTVDMLNNIIILFQLKLLFLIIGVKHPILWVGNIRSADFVNKIKWNMIIYHMSDLFNDCPYTKLKEILIEREKIVTEKSDVIICVSKLLYESKKGLHPNTHYLPHGVDFELFNSFDKADSVFLSKYPKDAQIVGYYGTLTEQNDIELLEYCARELKNYTFVFAGKVTAGDYSNLFNLPNVIHLGQLPYNNIPDLCSTFDVCLLPWKMNPWIKNCNPLKLFEYMASGNTIVSVPIDEVYKYKDLISIANTKEEYVKAIEFELNNDTLLRKNKRIEIANSNSWNSIVDRINSIVEGTHNG